METKGCSKCGQEFPATREYFKEHKLSEGGLRAMCRSCQREHDKQHHKPPLNDSNVLKWCAGCETDYPAITEYFYPLPTGKYGLTSNCRACTLERNRQRIVEINTDPNIVKTCSKCDKTYPAIEEYFTPTQGGLYGLTSQCKVCRRENTQKWRDENPESVKEYAYNYYWEHRDYLLEKNREWHRNNKERRRQSHRDWYIKNADHARKKRKDWYADNTDRAKEYDRQRYEANAEAIREYARHWKALNPDKVLLQEQKRRARELSLPDTLTTVEWRKAVQYWDGRCTYCGEKFDRAARKRTLDHYVPISHLDCPGTTVHNCIPACISCNMSKWKKDAAEWLKWKFGDEQGELILRKIQTYFDFLREK